MIDWPWIWIRNGAETETRTDDGRKCPHGRSPDSAHGGDLNSSKQWWRGTEWGNPDPDDRLRPQLAACTESKLQVLLPRDWSCEIVLMSIAVLWHIILTNAYQMSDERSFVVLCSRICFGPEEAIRKDPIIEIGCHCRDDLRFGHLSCLTKWFNSRYLDDETLDCELCR